MDICVAFTSEEYQHSQPIYIREATRFDKKVTLPDRPMDSIRHQMYGPKSACNIYHVGLDTHLRSHEFLPTEYEICLYVKQSPEGPIMATVARDELLLRSPINQHLTAFQLILEQKYRVKNLGPPLTHLSRLAHLTKRK